ncbi:hypothetical protein P692DRAFT_201894116 [Suillus brevipes Sb2]|nr:hypothetical protein P692DRAFT_201894116 [Suillus brevipes Sb2]
MTAVIMHKTLKVLSAQCQYQSLSIQHVEIDNRNEEQRPCKTASPNILQPLAYNRSTSSMLNSADSSSPPLLGYDTYAHYGRNLIQAFDDKPKLDVFDDSSWVTVASSVDLVGIPDAAVPLNYQTATDISSTNHVGILGAGANGLYTALILQDLGFPYRIIEAQGKVGGRLFTFKFEDETGSPYNYFDIGAMRFPNQADLSPKQSNALRTLNYGPSVKIGMQFRTAWWLHYTYFRAPGGAGGSYIVSGRLQAHLERKVSRLSGKCDASLGGTGGEEEWNVPAPCSAIA